MSYFRKMEDHGLGLAQVLFEENTYEEIEADLQSIGKDKWIDWWAENQEDILQYLGSTPASRTKKWPDIHIRRRLTLAALVAHRFAIAFEDATERFGASNGLSYRDAHKRAALYGFRAYLALSVPIFPLQDLEKYQSMAYGDHPYDAGNYWDPETFPDI